MTTYRVFSHSILGLVS